MKTSYYSAAAKLDRKKYFLVRTSIGSPRFLKCDYSMQTIAPDQDFLSLDEMDYKREYSKKLTRLGSVALAKEVSEIQKMAGKKEVVFLCFESLSPDNVENGQFCHRRIFAKWWERKTGESIDELSAPSKKPRLIQLGLF